MNIQSNSFRYLNKLKKLEIEWNKIEQIDSDVFQGLGNLEELILNGNKLNKIESNSFRYLIKLKKLDLRKNKMQQNISNGFQGLDHLEELNLFEN